MSADSINNNDSCENDFCGLCNHNLERFLGGVSIFSLFEMKPKYRQCDSFENRNLLRDIKDNGFTTNLDYSDWSIDFVHGADMFPGLYKGLSHFLSKIDSRLATINKLEFKKITNGDLEYRIFDKKDVSHMENCNIYIEFTDAGGNLFYAYGVETPREDREIFEYNNNVSMDLAKSISQDDVLSGYINSDVFVLRLKKLLDINDMCSFISGPSDFGYVRLIVLDLVNIIYQLKWSASGLVVSYNNLFISSGFVLDMLFDGSCSFVLSETKKPVSLGEKGTIHRGDFKIIDLNGDIILSGGVKLLQK